MKTLTNYFYKKENVIMATTEKKFLSYEKLGYYDEKIKKGNIRW